MKKVLLIITILSVGTIIALSFLLRTDLVSDKVKALAVAEIINATNHNVRIEKAVINLIPAFIELKGIELFNNEGRSIVKIKRARGFIGLGRPLQKELKISVKMTEPYFIIERYKDGSFSLSPLITSIEKYLKEERKIPVKIDFKGLSVEKGEMDLFDEKESFSARGKGLSLNLRTVFLRKGFRINVRADELKTKIRTLPELILKAESRLTLHGSQFTVHTLRISNLGSSIGVEGNINLSDKPEVDLKTRITLIARSFTKILGLKKAYTGEVLVSGKIKGDLPIMDSKGYQSIPHLDLDVEAEIPIGLLKEILIKEGDIEGTVRIKGNLKGKYPELISKGEISLSDGEISGIRIKNVGSKFSYEPKQLTLPGIKGEILEGMVEGKLTALIPGKVTELQNINGDGWIKYIKGKETRQERRVAISITPSIIETAEINFSSIGGYLTIEKGNISSPYSSAEFTGSLSLNTLEGEFPFKIHSENFGEWVDPYYKGTKGLIDIAGEITGPIGNPTINGNADIRTAEVKGVPIQRAYGSVRYKEKGISVSGFQIEQENSTYLIDGSIQFRTEGPYYNAKAKIKNGNPRKITSIFYRDLPVDTSVNGEMTFRGSNRDYEGEAGLLLNSGRAYGEVFDKARIKAVLKRVQGKPGEINFPSVQIEKGGDILYVDGRIGFDESFHGTIFSKKLSLGNINILNPSSPPSNKWGMRGVTSLRINGKGTFKKPEIFADLRLEKVAYRESPIGEGNVAVSIKDGKLQASAKIGGLRFEGEMNMTDDLPWNTAIFLRDMRLNDLFTQTGEDKSQSRVSIATSGSIKAEGKGTDIDKLSLIVKLNSISLNIFGHTINNYEVAEISLKNRDLKVHSLSFKGPEGSSIEIGGDLRIKDFYNLYLYGKADIGIMRPLIPQIESFNGDGEFMLALSDRWEDPRFQGTINLKGGSLKIRDLPQRIGKLSGKLTFDKDRIILDSLQGELGGGRLDFSGFAVLKGFSFRNFYIQGNAYGIRYRYFEGLTTNLNGRLVYEGDGKSQTLSGEIIFNNALYTRRIDWKSWLLEVKKVEEKPKAEVSPLLSTNLNIYISGKLDVDNNIGKGPVGLDLILKGTPIRPLLFGRIESAEGKIFFRNNSFRIISASADFFDPNRIYPVFNVVAVTQLKGYRVNLSLNGPIDRFSLSLSSDPPLSDTDLLALLTVGQPTKGLQGLEAGIGASEAASFLTGKLQDVLEERFRKIAGLDRFQVDPYVTRSSSAGGPRLTVGKNLLNGRLYMTYSANIGTSDEQVIRIEYILGKNISLVGVRDEQGQVGGDLKFRFEFR